jgi:hypothetical protein
MATVSEQLTAQFYEWEQRGRGWQCFNEAVYLEPHFFPFFGHSVKQQQAVIDDGKRHTIFSMLGEMFKRKPVPELEPYDPYEEDRAAQAHIFECNEPNTVFSLALPKGEKIDLITTEQLLLMLSNCRYPISFEIVGSSTYISIQLVCRQSDAVQVRSQVKAYFPECIIKERNDLLEDIVCQEDKCASILHYGLREEFMRPLQMAKSFKPDPLIGILGTLEHLKPGEYALIQILFQGTINPWSESIMRSVTDGSGKPFFENAPEMVPFAKEKISAPLFGVAMRVMGVGYNFENAHQISNMVGKALGRIYFSDCNSLIPLSPQFDFETNVLDILRRETHMVGMLLNSKELATVVHLPSDTVVTDKLERGMRKTKAAPQITERHELVLGLNEHQGKEKLVTVSVPQRLKHTHVIGATGTGKSTFILSLIVQDIQHGKGLAVLDPHGDLIESILSYIPAERAADVIIIDPADAEFPVGFNVLSAHSEIEKDILSSDLVAVFRRLSTSWGDQMNSVFANAILAILESKQGGTLMDLRRFLIEKPFRDTYLKTVSDPNIVYYWQKEYPLLKSSSIGPILTRLDTFLRPKLIRNMVAQKKGLDFEHILDSQKILLVKLSQGLIGTENSYLLGTFFVTKMYQAAMARQIKSKDARSEFFLYVDEFQNFITPSMSSILSGARKYGLGLILAHQDMQQLTKYDSELASSVAANAGTRICFRLGDTDAKRFDGGFSYFEAKDLENLHTGEAIGRIERPEFDFSLTTLPLAIPDPTLAELRKNAVIEKSRHTYGTPKEDVEAALEILRGELLTEETPKEEPLKSERKEAPVPPPAKATEPIELPISPSHENIVKKKEESQHRYLQTLIKRMAESRGYKTLIEEPTPDGKGRVDVHLERNGKRIAVEICNTTEPDWEMHNIEKCYIAGYDLIVACSNEKKSLENIRKKAETAASKQIQDRLAFFEPEAFFQYLDQELAKEASKEVRTKGYRVKVEYSAVSSDEAKQMSDSIVRTVTEAVRKKDKRNAS